MRLPSILIISCIIITTTASDVHRTKREEILQKEALQSVGGTTILTDKEAAVNNCLMRHKFNEVDNGFDKPEYYNFSHHYFSYKNRIKDSKVYRIIRDLPKGAALHFHDMAVLKADYLLNITYMNHLYVCLDTDIDFLFADSTPKTKCAGGWQLMSDARRKSGNIKKFDKELKKHFTMVCDDPDKLYPTIKETWSTFLKYFSTVIKLLTYTPNWDRYFYDVLKAFRDDNIMYVEVRSILPELYELDGTTYDSIITAKAYKKTINRFVKDYPDFIGAKLIFAPSRYIDRPKLDLFLQTAKKIKKDMPEYFAGFDLVGPEDKGKPLLEFVPQLEASAKDLNYFFHAGETDWYGTSTDCNLIDAILLGAKRLGHAYALPKHPVLMEEVRKRDIGIEVNVISNSVLSLVHDVRNHPLSVFLANGLPVVLSSDDPGAWGAEPISHDFYVAFVGVASRLQDLRLLKTLALNSLKYSALGEAAKLVAFDKFGSRWNDFVNKFNCSDY